MTQSGYVPSDDTGAYARLRRYLPRTVKHNRLSAAIAVFEREWETATDPAERAKHQDQVDMLLRDARSALRQRKYNPGWEALHAATRMRLLAIDRINLEASAIALATEAREKLDGWRGDVARHLLPFGPRELSRDLEEAEAELEKAMGRPPAAAAEPSADRQPGPEERRFKKLSLEQLRARAWKVQWLLDGRAQNMYVKQEVIVNRAVLLLAALVALVVAALVVNKQELRLGAEAGGAHLPGLPLVALFGAMGASFNGIRSLFASGAKKVPEVVISAWFTGIRPVIGAAAAIVVYLAEAGGVINLATDTVPAMLTLAFVAGFSDALVVRVAGSIEKKGG